MLILQFSIIERWLQRKFWLRVEMTRSVRDPNYKLQLEYNM